MSPAPIGALTGAGPRNEPFRMSLRSIPLFLVALVLAACAKPPLASIPMVEREAVSARLMQDIETLASDELGGRRPGTPGGQMTVDYLTQRFDEVGLESGTNDPANPWRAPVNLTAIRGIDSQVELMVGDKKIPLTKTESVAVTSLQRVLIAEAEMVFVGYEAEAIPADRLAGKVAVMLADRSLNPERRILLEAKQASAVIVVPDLTPELETLIVQRIRQDAGGQKIGLSSDVDNVFAAVATQEAMARALGQENWAKLTDAASMPGFEPMDLDATVNIEATTERRDFVSYNVVGRLPGAGDIASPDKRAVLLLAHWDHLGECAPPGSLDRICNGAVDNASGLAVMLELTRRLAQSGPYSQDIYVLATTAEEVGLLGAQSFVANPPIPLDTIVGAFNFDTVALAPAGSAVGFIGEGRTPLDPLILETLAETGRGLGNRDFAEGFVQRNDAWVLLDKGVPAVLLSSAFGSEITAGPYFESAYHRPSDESDTIELGGAIDDLLLHEELVKRLAIPAAPQP